MIKKILPVLIICLALTACKKDKSPEVPAPIVKADLSALAVRSMASHDDWTRDIALYIEPLLTCANASPVQTKYVFRADAFENPTVTLILLKGEDDKVYACGFENNEDKPRFQTISVKIPEKATRFYPGELPKPDSCLNNSRILDDSGHTAGWLSKITC